MSEVKIRQYGSIKFWKSHSCYVAISRSGKKYWIQGSASDGEWQIQDPITRVYLDDWYTTLKAAVLSLEDR
jgi:hypothetical protein